MSDFWFMQTEDGTYVNIFAPAAALPSLKWTIIAFSTISQTTQISN